MDAFTSLMAVSLIIIGQAVLLFGVRSKARYDGKDAFIIKLNHRPAVMYAAIGVCATLFGIALLFLV
jgi:hypothetical protein